MVKITSLKVDAETLILGENNNARSSSSACPHGCYVTWDLLDLTIAQLQTTLEDLQRFSDRFLVSHQEARSAEIAEPSATPEPSKMPDPSQLAIVPFQEAGPEKMSLEQVLATPVTSANLGLQLRSMMAIMNGPENPFKQHEAPTSKVDSELRTKAKAKATPKRKTRAGAKAAAKAAAKKRPAGKKTKSKAKAKAKARSKAKAKAQKASANSKRRKQLEKEGKSADKPADVNPKRPKGPQLTDEQKAEKKEVQKLMHSVSWAKD